MESCFSDHHRQNLSQKILTMVTAGTLVSDPISTLAVADSLIILEPKLYAWVPGQS